MCKAVSELNEEQAAAVTTNAQSAVVLAGAGSGKTRVLAARVLELLDRGASPSQILVVTFTRKAAGEMGERIHAMAEPEIREQLGTMWVGTFHAIALRIIGTYGHVVQLDPDCLTICNREEADELLSIVADSLKLAKYTTKAKKLRDSEYNGTWVDAGMEEPEAYRVVHAYWKKLRSMNVLDYGMIVTHAVEILKNDAALQAIRSQIHHVLVDEVQDIDRLQFEMVTLIAGSVDRSTVFAVGDERQSIYGFRGAVPDLFRTSVAGAQVYHLRRCHRCPPMVVEAANKLIGFNNGRHDTTEMKHAGPPKPGSHVERLYQDPGNIADVIRKLPDGTKLEEVVILARRNNQLTAIAGFLEGAQVPFLQSGAKANRLKEIEVRALLAVFRLAVNRRDDLAWMTLVRCCLGYVDHAQIETHAAAKGIGYLEAAADLGNESAKIVMGLDFQRMTAWSATFMATDAIAGFSRLKEVPDAAQFIMDTFDQQVTVPEALRNLATLDSQDDLEGEGVRLMTMHGAKGLEFRHVILADFNDGDMPARPACRNGEDGIAEERRLAYVAMTRSQDTLKVIWTTGKVPSRFLVEAGIVG